MRQKVKLVNVPPEWKHYKRKPSRKLWEVYPEVDDEPWDDYKGDSGYQSGDKYENDSGYSSGEDEDQE
jgi:hypothetical protein